MTKTKLKVTKIQYDLEGIRGFDFYADGRTKEQVLQKLPKSKKFFIDAEYRSVWGTRSDGLLCEYSIRQHLEDLTGWMITGFEVLETTGKKSVVRSYSFMSIAEEMKLEGRDPMSIFPSF